MTTALYASLLGFLFLNLTMNVVKLRRKHKVGLGDGGHEDLNRAIRVQANFTETVPLALILMGVSEGMGIHFVLINIVGLMLLSGRVLHSQGLKSAEAPGKFRFYGMVLTLTAIALGTVLALAGFVLRMV